MERIHSGLTAKEVTRDTASSTQDCADVSCAISPSPTFSDVSTLVSIDRNTASKRGSVRQVAGESGPRLLDWDGLRWSYRSAQLEVLGQPCLQFGTSNFTPTANAVAQLLVARYRFWVSATEQAEQLRAAGIDVSRSLLARLLQRAASRLSPLANALRVASLRSDIIAVANHPVGVRHAQRLWVYVAMPSMIADNCRGTIATFRLTPDRHGGYATQELVNFRGYLFGLHDQGYDTVLASPMVQRVGCWNELGNIIPKLDPMGNHPVAAAMLQTIGALRGLEGEWQVMAPFHRAEQRRQRSRVHLDALRAALINTRYDSATPDNLRAFTHMILDCWDSYSAFLGDGRIGLSCSAASDLLDRYTERSNWVFGKDRGSHAALADMATILETCRINGVDAVKYLTKVLCSDDCASMPLPVGKT